MRVNILFVTYCRLPTAAANWRTLVLFLPAHCSLAMMTVFGPVEPSDMRGLLTALSGFSFSYQSNVFVP